MLRPLGTQETLTNIGHTENLYSDFDRDRLRVEMTSNEGPRMCKADVNGDGLEDVYVGGSSGFTGQLFLQTKQGQFRLFSSEVFEQDKDSEDCGCEFLDADNDGDVDLYVTSGGNQFSPNSTALIDRLYLNENQKFVKVNRVYPTEVFENKSVVKAADFDRDGDLDLFVGVRSKPHAFGFPGNGYILSNDGDGNFSIPEKRIAEQLINLGMITDATWTDINQDSWPDLVVVGEFMPVKIFLNRKGRLEDATDVFGLAESAGWWHRVVAADLDADGDVDLLAGNHGLNSRFKATVQTPVHMWVADFDDNGQIEHIISRWWGDQEYPLVTRSELVSVLPGLKKRYLRFELYKHATFHEIFPQPPSNMITLAANELRSCIFYNEGTFFRKSVLPMAAQFSSIYAFAVTDVDSDQRVDILFGGNNFRSKPEIGRYDGFQGGLLRQLENNNFEFVSSHKSGLRVEGEIRDIVGFVSKEPFWLMAVNGKNFVKWSK
jgi:hypothetical protein